MPSPAYAVTALGNAIVDVLARADEALIAAHNLPKGAMSLLEGADAQRLYDAMRPEAESSGGSAANTVAGMAALGGRTAFVGKVADDPLGAAFRARHPRPGGAFQYAAGRHWAGDRALHGSRDT